MINQEQGSLKTTRRIKFSQYNVEKSFEQDKNLFFLLTNAQSMLSIRQEVRQKKNQNDVLRIMPTMPDQENVNQLWMIKPAAFRKVEIVHFETDDVIDCQDQEARLIRGKQKPQQIFEMECANSKKSKIKTDEEVEFVKFKNINGSYLALQGILSLSKSKEDDDIQTFIKKKVHKIPKKLLDCTFIADPIEVKECFDLPNGNKNADVQIVLWEINSRANQRWIFQPPLVEDVAHQNYQIKNYLSGLYLDVSVDGKLIQSTQTEKIWQLRKQHQLSGELFCTKINKYLDKGEDKKLTFRSDMGKRWKLIIGKY